MFEIAYPGFVRRLAWTLVLGAMTACAAAGGLVWYLSRCDFLNYVDRAATSPRQSSERYLFACGHVWHSLDGGGQWTQLETNGLPFGAQDGYIAPDLKPGLLYLGLLLATPSSIQCWNCAWSQVSPAMFVSTDSGRTWRLTYAFKPGPAGSVSFVGVFADPEREVDAWAIIVHDEQVIFYNSEDGRDWRVKCSDRQPDVSASRCDMPNRIYTFKIDNE